MSHPARQHAAGSARPRRRPGRRPSSTSHHEPAPRRLSDEEITRLAGTPFGQLGLPAQMVNLLIEQEITAPFPIQSATIPDALSGRDILGRGQTGSGKTLAFGLPLLARIAGAPMPSRRPLALVLVPTRELAVQVRDVLAPLGQRIGVRTTTVVGGMPYGKQIDALRRGVGVLIATPGRLADLIEKDACSLADVRITVLDEADQMADLGFMPAVTALLDQIPADGQRMLFSATLDSDVDKLVKRYLPDPLTHSVDPPAAAVESMEHHLLYLAPREKDVVTAQIAARDGRTLLFVRTRRAADRLVNTLSTVGVPAAALHGGMTQGARTRTLSNFRTGTVSALVATDVAARGIHVSDISLVVHVDLPGDPKDYLHRAGRTARAGATGTVVSLVLPRDKRAADTIMRNAGVTPVRTRINAGDDALHHITGARTVSGLPLPTESTANRTRPHRSGGAVRHESRHVARHESRSEPRPESRGEVRWEPRRGPRHETTRFNRRTTDRRPTARLTHSGQ